MSPTEENSLKWKVRFTPTADKQFEKLDRSTCHSINRYILNHLATEENPRRFGKSLTGNLKEFWRYRIGDYRLICEIHDHKLTIIAVKIAHRRDVYKNVHLFKSSL